MIYRDGRTPELSANNIWEELVLSMYVSARETILPKVGLKLSKYFSFVVWHVDRRM